MCFLEKSDLDGIKSVISVIIFKRTTDDKMQTTKYLSAQEAAALLGVSVLTIYGWTSDGKMPYRKVGRLLRFTQEELDQWMKEAGSRALDQAR